MVNWQEPQAYLRLIDLTSTALAYGCGATERSIHNQLYKCRQLADVLKTEVEKSGVKRAPRGSENDAATAPKTPRTPRVQSGGISKSGGGGGSRASSSRARGSAAAKGKKNLDTPTKTGKGTFTTAGYSMIDAIAVDSHDEDDSVISLTRSETISIIDDAKKEEAKEELKREVDLTTPEPAQVQQAGIELFGQRPAPPRVDSQSNGYATVSGSQTAANAADEFSINDIFDAIH
ncbi:hypothetical protein EIK77_004070 [Talaromyces pinophilus]|nr:hypothetical protein EIK77_004070 [Talaromyces pinophilus]PCG90722.1 Hypothetical protein PENO1_097650 [Penicillium occitanis (nom. inval.)]PCG93437.1 hypothetical protein PENOC_087640 [Penicillium occitanis (nom. inval.)]